MGTTVVFMLVLDDTAIIASVGDCRAYLHRAGSLHLLTHDHSLAQYLLDNQMVNADDPRLPFARRQLLQHLGMATPPAALAAQADARPAATACSCAATG